MAEISLEMVRLAACTRSKLRLQVDVLVIGDQAVRLASMLTTPEQRNTCSSYLGLTRMSHVFCADDYWYTVPLYTHSAFSSIC